MKKYILLISILNFSLITFSQVNKDSLKQILSSKSFTLEEEYIGDWGGYTHLFNFSVEGNYVTIFCKNPELLKNGKNLNVKLPISEINNLENIFINCSEKIKTTNNKSTERIFYKFKNSNITLIIDDRFTMECNEDFKAWKEMLLIKNE
ncbi:MAG: hypothetical protein HY951_04065 [Bacteroidia bacterium]|nr:hypothetical protein [Bacteroidia bacterium]